MLVSDTLLVNESSPTAENGALYQSSAGNTYKEHEIDTDECEELLIAAALRIEEIIEGKKIINWEIDQDVQNKLVVEIGDYIFDKVNNQIGVDFSFVIIDVIVKEMVAAAKTRG